jgi:PKD domain/Secretion system C-terminal sorting domain
MKNFNDARSCVSLIFLLLLYSNLNSQCVAVVPQCPPAHVYPVCNSGFETVNCPIPLNFMLDDAFNISTNCVQNWNSAHFTPAICGISAILPANYGANYACLIDREAIVQNFNFCAGEKYSVSFEAGIINANSYGKIDIYAASNISVNPPNNPLNISSNWQLLGSKSFAAPLVGWKPRIQFPIQVLQNNQTQFLIVVTSTMGNAFAVGIDNIDIQCESSINPQIVGTQLASSPFDFTFTGVSQPPIGFPTPTPIAWCWQFGDGTTSNIGPTVNHSYSGGGIYDVCLTITDACGCVTRTSCVSIATSCGCVSGRNIDASSNNPAFNAAVGGVLYSDIESYYNLDVNNDDILDQNDHNGCIAIHGRLIINRDVDIIDAELHMLPNSEIVVQRVNLPNCNTASPTLKLENDNIFSCKQMWRGINVQNNCHLNLFENQIRDAEFAVTASAGSEFPLCFFMAPTTVDIRDNTFTSNHVGIKFNSGTVGFPNLGHTILDNVFLSTPIGQNLLPSCTPNLPNYNKYYGYAGIISNGVDILVGMPPSAMFPNSVSNSFADLRNGVLTANCNAMIVGNDFQNIRFPTVFTPYSVSNQTIPTLNNSYGNAIFSSGGFSTITSNNFNTCGHAVYATTPFGLNISKNRVTNVAYGFETFQPTSFKISQNKKMRFAKNGIIAHSLMNGFFPSFEIAQNTGSVGIFPGYANSPDSNDPTVILDNGIGLSASNLLNARISDNEWNIDALHSGFSIKSIGGWVIDRNIVANCKDGFVIETSNKNSFYENSVAGALKNGNAAYSLKTSTETKFCCNLASTTTYGHKFEISCGQTDLRHSDLTNHEFVLHCTNTAIGLQDEKGNAFNATSGTAFHGGSLSQINASWFNVNGLGTPTYPEAISAINQDPNNPWFDYEGHPNLCSSENGISGTCQSPMKLPQFRGEKIDEVDRLIATDGFLPESPVLNWEGAMNLYLKIHQNSKLLDSEPEISTFYQKAQTSQIGAFSEAEMAMKAILEIPTELAESIHALQIGVETNNEIIENKLKTLQNALNKTDSSLIFQEVNSLMSQTSKNYSSSFKTLLDELKTKQEVKRQTAIALNEGLIADDIFQLNKKNINNVYLQTLATGIVSLTAAQVQTVSDIANQCFAEGGSAVLDARTMYQLVESKTFLDDSLCQITNPRNSWPKQKEINQKFRLLPNPANQSFSILGLPFIDGDVSTIEIVNIQGQIVKQFEIGTTQGFVSTENMPDGIYFVRFVQNGHLMDVQKLTIFH